VRTPPGAFTHGVQNAVAPEIVEQIGDHRGAGHVREFWNVAAAENGTLEHIVKQRHGKLGAGQIENPFLEALVKVLDRAGLVGVGLRLDGHTLQKEGTPASPTAGLAEIAQAAHVLITSRFKKSGEIEARLAENLFLEQKKRYHHAPEPAIPINERVQNLKLSVDDGELDQDVRGVRVPVGFPTVQVVLKVERRRRNEGGFLDWAAGFADPVLDGAEPATAFIVPAHTIHEHPVKLDEGVQTKWPILKKLFGKLGLKESMRNRPNK